MFLCCSSAKRMWSIASQPIGRCSITHGTASPAAQMSAKATTTSARFSIAGVRYSSARRTVAQVDSVPTSARARLKPFSGSSSSRL